MAGLAHDVVRGVRALRRTAGFTVLAASVLALGIGACSAIVSLLDAALIRPLPFENSRQLVMLWERAPQYAHNRVSPLNFHDWSAQQHSFASIAAVAGGGRTLTGQGETAERIPGQAVTFQFFDVFGIRPIAGRTFGAQDATQRANVVVLSERLWRTRFGADRTLIGRTLMLDDDAVTIIGVVPADFRVLYRADMWTLFVPRTTAEQRHQHYLQVVGRLKPDVTLEQARSDMAAIADGIASLSPETNKGWSVTIESLHEAIVGSDLRTTSLVLAAVVGLLFLMACANVGNLILARGFGRAREIAVRTALGASRADIVRQLMVESLLLATLGGTGGVLLAWLAVRAAPSFIPPDTLPHSVALVFDARLCVATALITIVSAILCGLTPAWKTSGASMAETLGSGGRSSMSRNTLLHWGLATFEVAAAAFVLTGAGLLIRTLAAIDAADPGFRARGVLTGSIGLSSRAYNDVRRMLNFYASVERELTAIPGVSAAALGGSLPLDGWDIGQGFEIVGDPPVDAANVPSVHYQIVSAEYFRTLGIDLIRGRPFTRRDSMDARPVCIVSEAFVDRYLRGREPLGLLVKVQSMDLKGGPTPVVREIVGVARQVAESAGETERGIQLYVPIMQNPWFTASVALRTDGEPLALAGALRSAIAKVDRNEPVTRIRTLEEVAAESTSQPQFRARLVSGFALLAVLLASIGIFGVLTYTVQQRTREFGVRAALGAQRIDVLRLVLHEAVGTAILGLSVGLGLAALLAPVAAGLLYRVKPLDPVSFFATAAVLIVTVMLSCALPALRAMQVDPAALLREE
jgi:putative ABC transport system permease protein